MTARNSNAPRGSATSQHVAERLPHRGGSLNIARLPFAIREQLNHQLLENVPAREILKWLETDPTVDAFLQRLFEGRKITEQNISEWRQGGYQEWLTYRECIENVRDLAEDAARVALTNISAEHLLLALTATYAELLKKWGAMPEIAFNRKLIVLEDLTKLALAMRRSEQRDARLQLDRERVEILRDKHRDKSPSSSSSQTSSGSKARPSAPAHPLQPKAPEIHHPTVRMPPDDHSDDWLWTSTGPNPYPTPFGASPSDRPNPASGPAEPMNRDHQ